MGDGISKFKYFLKLNLGFSDISIVVSKIKKRMAKVHSDRGNSFGGSMITAFCDTHFVLLKITPSHKSKNLNKN